MHLNWFREKPEDYIEKMKGTDKDLAAHFTIITACGMVLYGEKIDDVFGEVPREDYIDSIWQDIRDAHQDILDNPMYITLNLCRVLAYLQENLVLSKQSGGEWGIRSLPHRFRPLIQDALRSYATDEVMRADPQKAVEFADDMLSRIGQYMAGSAG